MRSEGSSKAQRDKCLSIDTSANLVHVLPASSIGARRVTYAASISKNLW
ncbi:hypothetical protein C7S13_2321 [Burkholderia cepacia]|nr:hypothetical protein [Burkholderia cepacia]